MTELFPDTRIKAMYLGGWTSEDHDELIESYDITSEEADAICAKLAELEEADLPTIRDELIESGENLGWCKPVYVGDLVFAQSEGQIVSVKWVDKEADREPAISDIMREAAEHMLGAEAVEEATRGVWHDEIISSTLAQELVWRCTCGELDVESGDTGCCNCPWFETCQALDDVQD